MDCPTCGTVCVSEKGLLRHMAIKHGGTREQNRDIARASLPGRFSSMEEVVNAMPESDSDFEAKSEATSGPGSEKDGETKSGSTPRRNNKQRLALEEDLIRRATVSRFRRLAKMPYSIWAAVAHDPSLRLNAVEEEELTASYVALAEAYGWQAAGKLWCWFDLTATQCVLIGVRSDAFKRIMDSMSSVPIAQVEITEVPPAAPGEEPLQEPPGPDNLWGRR